MSTISNNMVLCKIKNCGQSKFMAELCTTHYSRKKRYGDPLFQTTHADRKWHTQGNLLYLQLGVSDDYVITDSLNLFLKEHKWRIDSTGYASTLVDKVPIRMHQLIMNPDKGYVVDHINMNRLDNRLENLRICTHSQNQQNRKVRKQNTTGYKGVKKNGNRWQSRISNDHQEIYLGLYKEIEDAALAYDIASIQLFGDYGRTNIL